MHDRTGVFIERKLNKIEGKSSHLAVYFTDEQLSWIERRASDQRVSKGSVVRDIVAMYMKAKDDALSSAR